MKFPSGIQKVKRPSFRDVNGRSWVECDVVMPDGSKVNGHYEIVRGSRFYFEHEGYWYGGSITRFDTQDRHAQAITPDLQNPPPFR